MSGGTSERRRNVASYVFLDPKLQQFFPRVTSEPSLEMESTTQLHLLRTIAHVRVLFFARMDGQHSTLNREGKLKFLENPVKVLDYPL
ncbi:hypothetical protein NECAME_14148 [Necator americanus]|uniref:Uncharacterized protein n=1 Tax=Necator americanus TaxID=51031 RepID=W2SPN2_NECAM|nr:hypothetical protein NECAME_14148 [Necator americanus]ETN71659.1 hypothetical protein NECAME_14148 [Necator americanus]